MSKANRNNLYYITEENNSVCVWNGSTGECVFSISRYNNNYTGYEQAHAECLRLNAIQQ